MSGRTSFGEWADFLDRESLNKAILCRERALQERKAGAVLYPPDDHVFRAFKLTPPEKVKAVILGQDPYMKEGQANGLAFSVNKGCDIPPSLKNIFKELHEDIPSIAIPSHGDLTKWAENGVLLLNTALTVYEGRPNSCEDWGWQELTREVVETCSDISPDVVFLLWGRKAQAYKEYIQDAGRIVMSSHPSPLGATKASSACPAFLGSRPFSKANAIRENRGASSIDWRLD